MSRTDPPAKPPGGLFKRQCAHLVSQVAAASYTMNTGDGADGRTGGQVRQSDKRPGKPSVSPGPSADSEGFSLREADLGLFRRRFAAGSPRGAPRAADPLKMRQMTSGPQSGSSRGSSRPGRLVPQCFQAKVLLPVNSPRIESRVSIPTILFLYFFFRK